MKRLFVTAALFMTPALSLAGDHASFHVSFGAPPTLTVIQPGVQVVVDHDDAVFYADRRYWVQRDGGWYSARHHGDAFAYAPQHRVPAALVSLEPGRYRHYRPAAGHGSGHSGGHGANVGHGGHGGHHGDARADGHGH